MRKIYCEDGYNMSKIDILNLEWSSSGRDIHIIEPVLCYLEKEGYHVCRSSYLFPFYKIIKNRPKMIVISNNNGSISNFNVSKFAYLMGINVVTLTSEGDYCILDNGIGDAIKSFFWGWDLAREFPVDLHLEWSSKNINLIDKYVGLSNEQFAKVKVSGATGFDRYSLLEFKTRDELLSKYNKNGFKKVIGYAAWMFDCFVDESYWYAATCRFSDETAKMHMQSKELVKKVLKDAIENNPDILFILKRHPGEVNYCNTELADLEKYNNVLMLMNEEQIDDVINVCNFWMAYESTTCLEAWLLNKQTVLINPIEFTDNRSEIAQGSPVITNYEALQRDIDIGHISGFDELHETRKNIITKIIEHSDGKNYIRAGNYIIEEFKRENTRKMTLTWWSIKKIITEVSKTVIYYSFLRNMSFFARYIHDWNEFSRMYSDAEREEYVKKYKNAIE